MTIEAGDLVTFKGGTEEYPCAIVLRTSVNEHEDGSKDEYAEIADLPRRLVFMDELTPFGDPLDPPTPDVKPGAEASADGIRKPTGRTPAAKQEEKDTPPEEKNTPPQKEELGLPAKASGAAKSTGGK